MAFTRRSFGLFWSLPPDAVDWRNLELSGCRLVMLAMDFADALTLHRLKDLGCKVILRVNEGAYYQDDAPVRVTAHAVMANEVLPVVAVIVGNEPENALNFEYGSNTFGQDFAYLHRRRFDAVRVALQAAGIKVVSPAQTMRSISEDEAPQPGQIVWREICCLPEKAYTEAQGRFGYLSADYNGVHLYCYGWDGPVDEVRFKFALKYAATLWHKELVVDEVGVAGNHTPLEKMAAYIGMAEILLSRQNEKQHPLGQRVSALIPFCSNGEPGNPPAWDRRYLIRDPACYKLLGNWMNG